MKTGKDKISIFNPTQKIRTLKGQTKTNQKDTNAPRALKSVLMPGVVNLIPVSFWNIYKRQKIVQAWLYTGIRVEGDSAAAKDMKAQTSEQVQHNAKEVAEAAV